MIFLDSVKTAVTAARSSRPARPPAYWPLWIIGSGCFVAIWGGWVGLGGLTGFGPVELLPGIWDSFRPNTAITLPLSMEVYGSYALRYWIDRATPKPARVYAMWSAIASLALGLAGQGGYHLMDAHHFTPATTPWPVTVAVAWVPVIAFGLGAGLRAMLNVPDKVPAVPAADGEAAAPEAAGAPVVTQAPEPPAPGPELPAASPTPEPEQRGEAPAPARTSVTAPDFAAHGTGWPGAFRLPGSVAPAVRGPVQQVARPAARRAVRKGTEPELTPQVIRDAHELSFTKFAEKYNTSRHYPNKIRTEHPLGEVSSDAA